MKKYVYILLLLASVSTLATAQIKIGNYTFKDGGEYTGYLERECRCIPERPYRQTGRGNHFIRGNLVGQMPGLYRQPQGVSWGR